MADQTINLSEQKGEFRETVKKMLPDAANLNICLTCGTCAAGCPATGLYRSSRMRTEHTFMRR